jgi:ABC-2 type transport system permease protein
MLGRFARTATIWAVAFTAFLAVMVLIFPQYRDSGVLSTYEEFPEAMREAFNMDIASMTAVQSFLSVEFYSYAPLVLAFLPIMALTSVLAGDEERAALDITLGLPMPRRHVVLSAWIAIAILLLGIVVLTGVVSWGVGRMVDAGLDAGSAFAGAMSLYPITLAFGTLALALSAVLHGRGTANGITFVTMFFMFLADVIGKIVPDYDWIRWVSAFRFYGNAIAEGFSWGSTSVLLGATAILLLAAVWAFDRKDVYT